MILIVSKSNINKYVKAVSKHIHCDKKDKADCLSTLRSAIEEIGAQDEITDYNSIISVLGSPECVAEELESSIDKQIIKKHKKKIIITTVAAIILVVGLLIGLYFYLVYDAVQPVYVYESTVSTVQ